MNAEIIKMIKESDNKAIKEIISFCNEELNKRNKVVEKKVVFVPPYGGSKWKRWAKVLTGVDTSLSNGYCFLGEFIRQDNKYELPIGSFILLYGQKGSWADHRSAIKLIKVVDSEDTGNIEEVMYKEHLSNAWALDVRDDIANIIK